MASLKKPLLTNPQPLNSAPSEKFHIPVWLALLIVLLIALIGAAAIMLSYQKPLAIIKINPQEKNLPPEVHSFVGTITEVGADYIAVKAQADRNYLLKNTDLAVKIDDKTKIQMFAVPKQLTGDPAKDAVKSTLATLKDLKIGQMVIVFSAENIKNLSSFTASQIDVQVVK